MSSSSDRRAVFFLVALGAVGALIRLIGPSDTPPGSIAYRPVSTSRTPLDSVAARAARFNRPLKKGERIDLDVASGEEIGRLPRIGTGLAARIVADREKNGPFGSLEGLDRVNGVGPSLLAEIRSHSTFSGTPRPRRPERSEGSDPPVSLNTATATQLAQLPRVGPAKAKSIIEYRSKHGPFAQVDDLAKVPGFGPSTVKRLSGMIRVP